VNRVFAASALSALSVVVLSPAAHAAPAADIAVLFGPTVASVQSTKDLSNVVIRDCLGNEEKIESPAGNFFEDPDGIVTVWVKSGDNHSGDGPGYGERFDNPEADCPKEETPSTTTTTTPPLPPVTPEEPTTTTTTPEPAADTLATTTTTTPTTTGTETLGSPSGTTTPAPTTVPIPRTELPRTGTGSTVLVILGGWLVLGGIASLAMAQLIRGAK